MIDGNAATYWHSRWTTAAANYLHQFVIAMADVKTADVLQLHKDPAYSVP
ncbi:hypothetical protein [Flavobacterium sp. T12S277]